MFCAACDNHEDFSRLLAREMMFGTRTPFQYATCGRCGTMQIVEIPADLGKYYPDDYYSISSEVSVGSIGGPARCLVTDLILKAPFFDGVAKRLSIKYPFLYWARKAGISRGSSFLDVGSGNGHLLRRMRKWGFSRLTGIDPYARAGISAPGFEIRKAEIATLDEKFDMILMSHVLEHLPDPVAALSAVRRCLKPDSILLVRVPVAGSPVALEYGPDWFNLDAPRHLVLPSQAGMEHVAKKAGLRIVDRVFDMIESSVYMSEAYRRNVAMNEAGKPSKAERNRLRQEAEGMNRAGRGDLVSYFMRTE